MRLAFAMRGTGEQGAYSKILLRGARVSTQRVGFLSWQMLRGEKVFSLRNLSVGRIKKKRGGGREMCRRRRLGDSRCVAARVGVVTLRGQRERERLDFMLHGLQLLKACMGINV